ncbi:tetratricopeptide repeat protein [Leptospira venezuelensis]|uniref:tetratricopeptide repeat protein n=1 Tax=Leptospira venezuelensis TaxID=1958811 RepID=UPI000A3CE076|nr:tetratricopeptide repeat protein [Leptospira venezuelensis]
MKHASIIPILLISVLDAGSLFASPRNTDSVFVCRDTDSSGKARAVWPAYYYSLGLESLNKARNSEGRERTEEIIESVKNFQDYIRCSESVGVPVSAVFRWNKALAHYYLGQWKDAVSELDLAEKSDPNFRESYILKGTILLNSGEYEKAATYLESHLSKFSEEPDFYYLLSSAELALKNDAKSVLYLSSLRDLIKHKDSNPKYPEFVYLSLGKTYFALGQNTKALFYISGYLEMRPENWEIRFLLAKILDQLGKFSQAKKQLQRILQEIQGNSSVELMLGEMYFIESRSMAAGYFEDLKKKGKLNKDGVLFGLYSVLNSKYSDARRILFPLKEKFPKRLSIRLGVLEVQKRDLNIDKKEYIRELVEVASIALQSQLTTLAETLLLESIKITEQEKLDPRILAEQYDFLAGVYEQSGSVFRSIISVRKAIQFTSSPEDSKKYELHLAFLLRGNPPGKVQESEEIIQNILKNDPNNHYAYYLLGIVLFQSEKLEASRGAFEQAIRLEPKSSVYHFYRASTLEKLGRIPEMESDLRKSMELDPENPIAYNYLGYHYSEKGIRLDEALDLIRKAVELAPDNEAYQDSLGWIYYKKGRVDEALLHLNLAFQILQDKNEFDPTICEHLGDVHHERREFADARRFWEKSETLFQKKEDKVRIREKLERLRTNPVSNKS